MQRRWVMIGATSALGFGLVAGGAVLTANALALEDSDGKAVGESITIAQGSAPTPTVEAEPAPPAPVSVVAPASPISVGSPESIDSPDSPPSAD